MINIIVSVALIGLSIACFKLSKHGGDGVSKVPIRITGFGNLLIAIFASIIVIIPTGYTGIVTTLGKVDETKTLDAGISIVAPWQDVVKMDNRLQEISIDLACFSSDIQEVDVALSVGYRINQQNAMLIYKEVGKDYADKVITPQIKEVVKSVIAHYNAGSLIESRDKASQEIDDKLRTVLSDYNIDLSYASITNLDFTDTFENAVEAKVKAQQEKQQAEAVADKLRVEAKAKADAAVIEAEAEAEKNRIAADAKLYEAEKEAEGNKKIQESITSTLIDYKKITEVDGKWNGELPNFVGGESAIPVIGNIN